jgi:hypothetical protein
MAWEDQEPQQQQDVSPKGLWALANSRKDIISDFGNYSNYCHLSVDA